MKWVLIESYISDDNKDIFKFISNKDCITEKYTPSVAFLKKAYRQLNGKFFKNSLPLDIDFLIETNWTAEYAGMAKANDDDGKLTTDSILLNGTIMLTPHEWIEVIIHEMIHIYDFVHYPSHFTKTKYDAHGGWFMKRADKFKEQGFNIKDTFDSDLTNTADGLTGSEFDDCIFIKLGVNPILDKVSIAKINSKDKDAAYAKLKRLNCKSIGILKTTNLNALRLKDIDVKSLGDNSYHIDDEFNAKYGPFEEVDTIDLTSKLIDESYDRTRNLGWYRERLEDGTVQIVVS